MKIVVLGCGALTVFLSGCKSTPPPPPPAPHKPTEVELTLKKLIPTARAQAVIARNGLLAVKRGEGDNLTGARTAENHPNPMMAGMLDRAVVLGERALAAGNPSKEAVAPLMRAVQFAALFSFNVAGNHQLTSRNKESRENIVSKLVLGEKCIADTKKLPKILLDQIQSDTIHPEDFSTVQNCYGSVAGPAGLATGVAPFMASFEGSRKSLTVDDEARYANFFRGVGREVAVISLYDSFFDKVAEVVERVQASGAPQSDSYSLPRVGPVQLQALLRQDIFAGMLFDHQEKIVDGEFHSGKDMEFHAPPSVHAGSIANRLDNFLGAPTNELRMLPLWDDFDPASWNAFIAAYDKAVQASDKLAQLGALALKAKVEPTGKSDAEKEAKVLKDTFLATAKAAKEAYVLFAKYLTVFITSKYQELGFEVDLARPNYEL